VNYPLLTSLLLLGALAGFGWWLSHIDQRQGSTKQTKQHYPDDYASGLLTIRYDPQGEPEYRLKSRTMRHFTDDETTELEQPTLWQYSADAPPWRLHAESAILYAKADKVFMPGAVEIERAAAPGRRPYQITTSALWAYPDSGQVTTTEPVRITSQGEWVHGVGLQGWLRQPIKIKLLSEVRGYHEID